MYALLGALLTGCGDQNPVDTAPFAVDSCVTCHSGIEQAHPGFGETQCVICHGGDGAALDKETAHVAVPANWAEARGTALPPSPNGFIKDFAPDQLDQLPVEYLQFVNPGDIRAVDKTCGTCHAKEVAAQKNSVMTTNSGHYYPTLLLAGLQDDRLAHYGSFAAVDEECDPDTFPGSVCTVDQIRPEDADQLNAAAASGDLDVVRDVAYNHYLAKNCNTCHQAGYPRNDSPGLYRSSGCTSCHMVYDTDGTYKGSDPSIPTGTPTHASKHEITTAIPTEQCATCHFQGGRIGLNYRGIREGGFSSSWTPANAEPIQQTLYGKAPGYYFSDEDTTNSYDETPPDVHAAAGMVCADCHVGSDVHGDGRIYSTSKQQMDIACEDCHGTIDAAVTAGPSGYVETRGRARPLEQLSITATGGVVLTDRMTGTEREVVQIAELLNDPSRSTMHDAMGRDENGFSHAEDLTCDTCHSAWQETCIGCHVTVDFRLKQVDYQTGTATPGLTRGSRKMYSLDDIMLGLRADGRIQTVHASQQLQMLVYGSEDFGWDEGEIVIGSKVTESDGSTKDIGEWRHPSEGIAFNNGFTPFFNHTTTKTPYTCTKCHMTADTDEERARIKGILGFGTGEFMLEGNDGQYVDGLQFLDADGNSITTWVHEGTGPFAKDRQAHMLSIIVPAE